MARAAKKKQSTKLIALSATNKAYEFKKPLEKRIKYQGKEVDIKLHEDPKGFSYIVWKNKKYMLDVIEKKQNRYTIMVNGVWHSFTVETPVSLKRKRYLEQQVDASAAVSIEAPMPGKIVDIKVKVGQKVKQGDGLITVEAMKMQNEFKSQNAGVVSEVCVSVGDSVEGGVVMVVVE